jgi:hypothetical protein
MSDLKLESDGATRRYDIRGPVGVLDTSNVNLIFLAHLGEFDLLWDADDEVYTVVRVRPRGDGHGYNFTDYHIIGDALVARDGDVALDPYHMCLLYQAHEHFDYQPKEE